MSNTLGVEIFMGGRESPIAGQTPSGRYDDDFKAGSSSDADRPVQPDDLVVLTLPEEINQDEQVRVCKAKDLLPSSVFETFNLATPSGSMTLNVLAGIAKVGSVYNSYAQAWWNALPAGLKTDERYLSIYSTFADTVTNAVLAKLDVLYLCANHEPTGLVHATDSACLLNFINPAAHKMTLIGTPSTTKNVGVSGGGTHAFNMNYAPGDGGSHNLLQNSHAFGVWCNNMGVGSADMGCSTASGESPQGGLNIYHPSIVGASIAGRSASKNSPSGFADTAGLISIKRSVASGNVFYLSINDGGENPVTADITVITDQSLYLLGNNSNNTLTSATTRIISFAYAGAYLDNAEITLLYNAMSGLLTALADV